MTNDEIVKVLEEIGQLKEIKGENRFKVVAYEKAAHSLGQIPRSIEAIYREGGEQALDELPDVGVAIAAHIAELIKTGTVKEYEALKRSLPKGVIEYLKIPGVGPKTAVKLAERARGRSPAALKEWLKTRAAKEFTPKQKEHITDGITILEGLGTRLPIVQAGTIAEEVLDFLKADPDVTAADAVGSLRRHLETVGDIDLVASSREAKAVIERLKGAPFVKEVVGAGPTKTTFIHRSHQSVDVEILPPRQYGSLLLHFTGSKNFNVRLRKYALERGYSLSEHGLKSVKTGKLKTFPSEAELLKFFRLDFIPPEMREDQGEIELASQHVLPRLIEEKQIRGDLQSHSTWSDGRNTLQELKVAAEKLGYEYLAVTDHSAGLGIARGLTPGRIIERTREIRALNRSSGCRILNGIEVEVRADGSLDLPEAVLNGLDLVLISTHSAHHQSKAVMTKRILRALAQPSVHILAHPTGRLINRRPAIQADWGVIFKAAAQLGVWLEINAHPERLDLPDTLIREAALVGCEFVISTDAHTIFDLGLMRFGVHQARRGWLPASKIRNTMKLGGFLRTLHRKRESSSKQGV